VRLKLKNIDLVIFDCDGVLVDSEPLSAIAHQRVYQSHGYEISMETFRRCIGMKQKDILVLLHSITGFMLPETSVPQIWIETKALLTEQLKPTQGFPEFIAKLKLIRCVASSSSIERIHFSLGLTGLAEYFAEGTVFSSSMVKHGKPAPDLFLYAAEQCGVAPARCLVIEDSQYGVEAAVAAKMQVIGFTGGEHADAGLSDRLRARGANHICSNWHEVAKLLGER
jgi:HAD superfamily hydrolase (TIGR01509 family)